MHNPTTKVHPTSSSFFGLGLRVVGLLWLSGLIACGALPHPHDPEECGAPIRQEAEPRSTSSKYGVHVGAVACAAGTKYPSVGGFSGGIEGYASYVGQSTCSPSEKPGVAAFKNLLLATYPCTASYGIIRGCSVGGTSEHKEGRAFDWGVSVYTQKSVADSVLQWLLATDSQGNKHAMARRLGIMYMVWNRQIWRSYRDPGGWSAYSGSNPHTDHVHISFSWDGANKKTSFWTGSTSNVCSALQTSNCGKFGCQCAEGSCSGGFCPGTGCSAKEVSDCAKFGCQCVDHKCAGGFCAGTGCTAKEQTDCGKFGCNCVDHKCSGAFCAGTGCTAKETGDCKKKGCGCVDHKCSGGSCSGSGCTAKLDTDCKKYGCGCKDMKCVGGACCVKKAEVCDGKDNDCDGQIDEGVTRACKSACGSGKETCTAGKWGTCTAPQPQKEVCDGKDNNCDGTVDEGCNCKEGATQSCGQDVGECKKGTQTCKAGKWSACAGAVGPKSEVCDGKDNNCDGQIDEGAPGGGVCDLGGSAGIGMLVCAGGQLLCQASVVESSPEPVSPLDGGVPEGTACGSGGPCPDLPEGAVVPGKYKLGTICNDMSDCESNLCVTIEGASRCSRPCSTVAECPSEFECRDDKACWPGENKPKIDEGEQLKSCVRDDACGAGQFCDRGFCATRQGCSCQSVGGAGRSWLWGLLLLGLVVIRRSRWSRR